jgi:hypothetical protein
MKTQTRILIFLAAVCTLTSCIEPDHMLTVINSDGSCYREFSSNGSTNFMLGKDLAEQKIVPVALDSTWKITWRLEDSLQVHTNFPLTQAAYDSIAKGMPNEKNPKTGKIEKKKPFFLLTFRRDYKSVEEMASTFKLSESHEWSKMKVNYSFEKKFRWFYTYYTYKETYPKIDTKFKTPIDSFMTKDEATYWFTGTPNIYKGMNGVEIREAIGSLEDKYNHWFNKNMWDIQYDLLLKHFDLMTAPPVSKDSLAHSKDRIFDDKVNSNKDYDMEKILNKYFNTKAFSIFWTNKESPLKKFEDNFEKLEFVSYFGKEFDYNLCMPGHIKPQENSVMQGDTLNFKLTAYRMVYSDYVVQAESRKANSWAFIVSGLILALAIGSFWYKPKRKL